MLLFLLLRLIIRSVLGCFVVVSFMWVLISNLVFVFCSFSSFIGATHGLRMSRGIALLFCTTLGTRLGWGAARPPLPPGKNPIPLLQEAGLVLGPLWKGGKCGPHRYSIPDRLAPSSVALPTKLGAGSVRNRIPVGTTFSARTDRS